MGRPLFDKPTSELCAAFVRERFAQQDVFGRADIEAWLAAPLRRFMQADAEGSPWNARAFSRHLADAWTGRDEELRNALIACATPFPRKAVPNLFPDELGECLLRLLGGLTRGTRIYSVGGPEFIAVTSKGALTAARGGTSCGTGFRPAITFRPTEAKDVSYALMREAWSEQPKGDLAFAWLKEQYTLAIAAQREAAERNFDEAVAVSADGKKILKVEWVVVGAHRGRSGNQVTVFPAAAFRARKAQIPKRGIERSEFSNFVPESATDDVDFTVRHLLAYGNMFDGHGMLRIRGTPCGNVLFVRRSRCPSPLPEGGRVILS